MINNRFLFVGLFVLISWGMEAQQVITGRVTDALDGEPLPGAVIFIANTTIGTISDNSGNYKLTIQGEGVYEIVVSYTGYQTFFYKMDEPKPSHTIDVALETIVLPEVVITASKTYSRKDVDLFWRILLGVTPSKRGLEVLNPEKVSFYLSNDKVLMAFCNEPVLIINHEMGYNIRYELEHFQYDYRNEEYLLRGSTQFEELEPDNFNQKRRWEQKRKDVYSVSLTRFIRALYNQQLHENGFLLTTVDRSRNIPTTDSLKIEQEPVQVLSIDPQGVQLKTVNQFINFSLADILKIEQDRVQVSIDYPLYLGCFSKPVTASIIKDSYDRMLGNGYSFPVLILVPQQFYIYADGTYSGLLTIREIRNRISGLSARLPIQYMYNEE